MSDSGILSLNMKQDESFLELLKINFTLQKGMSSLKVRVNEFLILKEVFPRNGKNIVNSLLGTINRGSLFPYILLKNAKIHAKMCMCVHMYVGVGVCVCMCMCVCVFV